MLYAVPLYKVALLAVKAEEGGESFYRKVAAETKDESVKKVCLYFAEQEKEHKVTFDKIAEEFRKDKVERNFTVDVLALMNQGIEKLKSTGFQSPDFDASRLDLDRCLEIALDIELETVAIYEEIRREMDTNFHQVLYKIIKEENEHAESIDSVLKQRDPKRKHEARTVRIVRPDKIEIRKIKVVPNMQDYIYVIVIFLFLVGLILMMVGPGNITYLLNALIVK
jgi:rubrerythrin